MSKSQSARIGHFDWDELLARAEQADAPLSPEELSLWSRGLIDGNTRMWGTEYVHAVQEAVEKGDHVRLWAMLDAEIPPPAFLLPAIAAVIRIERLGLRTGKPKQLTVYDDRHIREAFDRYTRDFGLGVGATQQRLADARGLSIDTIKRSLKRTSRSS